jgi:hypothetical protein
VTDAAATATEPVACRQVPWWKAGAIYHLFPRSFCDSDGDGFGDLRGVIDRLDYLNDGSETSLGVSAIWLSPIYPSPWRDGGHDAHQGGSYSSCLDRGRCICRRRAVVGRGLTAADRLPEPEREHVLTRN